MATTAKGTHHHEFAVDASCDCGVMLSALVQRLTRDNAALLSEHRAATGCRGPVAVRKSR
jgi:hypothetical protein